MTKKEEMEEEKYYLEIKEEDKNKTLYNLLVEKCHNLNMATTGVILKYSDEYIYMLDYYYNEDGIVEFDKKIGDIPIKELEQYGININETVELQATYGMGGTSGFSDIIQFYENLELFLSMHPILCQLLFHFSIITYKKLSPLIVEKLKKIKGGCTVKKFIKSLHHKQEITIEEVNRAYAFKTNNKCDKDAVKMILRSMGYKYNPKKKKWILKK